MKTTMLTVLFVLLAFGSARAAVTDIFDQIRDSAPAMEDVFVEIERKAP